MAELRLLVIADIHYASEPQPAPPARQIGRGLELLRQAIEEAGARDGFDALALMGDLVNDGTHACAEGDLLAMKRTLGEAAPCKPILCIPGNHDASAERIAAHFGGTDATRELGGYRFLLFADSYAPGDFCTRRQSDRDRLTREAARDGGPIVVLQHNPMNPAVLDSDYPFMLTNREEVLADYARCGVLLSLSGHFHAGQPLNEAGGVRYFTAPALCETPFRYAVATLRGREVSVRTREL